MTPRLRRILTDVLRGLGRALASSRQRSCILCYHSVFPHRVERASTLDRFREQLEWLREHCDVLPLVELVASRHGDHNRTAVAITFDDGHRNNHEFAFPALAELRIPATFFLTAGYVDRDRDTWDRLRYFQRNSWKPEPMSWSQARELAASGMSIGAHSFSHRNLRMLETNELDVEISGAKTLIEDRLGVSADDFAYPFGKPRCHIDNRVLKAVREAGHRYAVTTVQRGVGERDPALLLPRLELWNDSAATLAEKVRGDWDPVGYYNQWCPRLIDRLLFPRGYRRSTYRME